MQSILYMAFLSCGTDIMRIYTLSYIDSHVCWMTMAAAHVCARLQVHGLDFYSGADGELSVEVYKSVKERLKRTSPDVEFRAMRTQKPVSGALVDERKRALRRPPTHVLAPSRELTPAAAQRLLQQDAAEASWFTRCLTLSLLPVPMQ